MSMNWEPTIEKLKNPDFKIGLEAVTELRDRIEVVHSPEYPNLLNSLLPEFINILDVRTAPNSDITSDEQKLRRAILEVMSRFPHNDTLKESATSLLKCAMKVLKSDYEENAMVANRIVFDLHHKISSSDMADYVQPFLDFVMESLRTLSKTVTSIETEKNIADGTVKSVASFKILIDCPLTVMVLFQLYPQFIKTNISSMIKLMMEALALKASSKLPNTKSRELVACQVKTLSFLTYLIRRFGEQMNNFKKLIAGNIVSLMQNCPSDAVSTRKELLVATRRILATEFREGFYPHIDILFDERVLIGSNYRNHSATSNNMNSDSLRPMGYSTLADLVHHVRSQLSLAQVSRVIYIFSRVIHDPSQPVSIQTTSARLLLNLVDYIFHNKESNDQTGRDLLVRILDTLVKKFGTLLYQIRVIKDAAMARCLEEKGIEHMCEKKLENRTIHEMSTKKRKFALGGNPEITDTIQDVKMIIKPMIMGIKTVIWCIKNYASRNKASGGKKGKSAASNSEERQQLTNAERELVVEYLTLALPCLKIFKWKPSGLDDSSNESKLEFREVLEHFAASFTVLDNFDIQRIIGLRLPFIFKHMLEDPDLLTLPQHLIVSNMTVSFNFCEVLLSFLVKNMEKLSGCDVTMYLIKSGSQTIDKMHSEGDVPDEARTSFTLLRLFKIVFQSLSLFPENENVLQSYLQTLVAKCLKFATQLDGPGNYFYLMLRLFRSIAGGKFEQSYKKLLPLLPTMLNALYRIFIATEDEKLRSNTVEIALAIPARLSSQYPHLPLLLKFILPALQSTNGDIVNLGLRTLEFWVDNLDPEYLYPILVEEESEVMVSLCNHLRPAPYPYGLLSLRLLGKLGGRNRRFLRTLVNIPTRIESDYVDLYASCEWMNEGKAKDFSERNENSFKTNLPMGPALVAAVDLLHINATAPQLKASPVPSPTSPDGAQLKSNDESPLPYPLELDDVLSVKIENVNLTKHVIKVMEISKQKQTCAAFHLIQDIVSSLCEVDGENGKERIFNVDNKVSDSKSNQSSSIIDRESCDQSTIYHVTKGLLYASVGEHSIEAYELLSGFASYLALWSSQNTARIDETGNQINDETFQIQCKMSLFQVEDLQTSTNVNENNSLGKKVKKSGTSAGINKKVKLPPLFVFGMFRVLGSTTFNPFIFNQALVDVLFDYNDSISNAAVKAVELFADGVKEMNDQYQGDLETKGPRKVGNELMENLLFFLCQSCFEKSWNLRVKVYDVIYKICVSQGLEWAKQFEVQIIQAALFAVKSSPRELTSPLIGTAFTFVVRIFIFFYDCPYRLNEKVMDTLSVPMEFYEIKPNGNYPSQMISSQDSKENVDDNGIVEMVVQILVGELASPKHLVRFTARFCLKLISKSRRIPLSKLLFGFSSLLKRMIFSRGLRYASIEDQIGIIEALSFVVEEAPTLYTFDDQHMLVHLSDLLRAASAIDNSKGGDTGSNEKSLGPDGDVSFKGCQFSSSRASAIFLRDEEEVKIAGFNIVIPGELPYGEQLRVSTLMLFRAVIRRHTRAFFSADSNEPIGNIRSHIINLLFRSLISRPKAIATVAFATLNFVISVGQSDSETRDIPALEKNLLNVCMKPVLFNLKDHQKLDVVLLEGMGRLLSLLSSMFNVTLGEKLLDHLKKWENPKLIMDHKVWRIGEEPLVAAGIIELFEFLPRRNPINFVDKLISAVIRLESVLPQYKGYTSIESPYRSPLTRYLSLYPDVTTQFFLNEQRLGNPTYIELFLDILRKKDANDLRASIADKPLQVLRMCFERPISIIRTEKQQHALIKSMSPVSLLSFHGITNVSVIPKSSRREIEVKERKVSALLQAERQTKKALCEAINSKSSSQSSIQDLKNKHKHAEILYNNAQRELTAAKLPNTKKPSDNAMKDLPSKPMTLDTLEWQYQGMKIVEALVENEDDFFEGSKHTELSQIYRLLWKSNGRHVRMIHEDKLPYKYKTESEFIAKILIKYSRLHPDDIDLLIDLLRIFMIPSGVDFTFVRSFLEEMVTSVLNLEQKKKLLERFFLVIGSEGNDESKILCVQLLILPLLREGLEKEDSKLRLKGGRPPTKDSITYKELNLLETNEEKKIDKVEASRSELVDIEFLRKFMKDALLQKGKTVSRSERLHIELLKVATLFIEFLWMEMYEHRKDLVKFTWNHLKNEESASKNWAYVNICHFIKAFDTPNKIILQVFISLLRGHQADKHLFQTSLNILIPSMSKRLPIEHFTEAIKWTKKIMFEEGHSISQLTHLWEIFIRHPSFFFNDRSMFVPHMVNSLNRLGLPPTSTLENRKLSLSVVDLVMCWENHNSKRMAPEQKSEKINQDLETETKKKRNNFVFNLAMIEVVLNFLIRIVLSNAESTDEGANIVCSRGIALFERGVKMWPHDKIRSIYFDKIFLSCSRINSKLESESKVTTSSAATNIKDKSKAKDNSLSSSASNATNAISTSSLIACLELLIILIKHYPHDKFWQENSLKLCDFIKLCFSRATKSKNGLLRTVFKKFLILIFSGTSRASQLLLHSKLPLVIKAQMESVIIKGGKTVDSETSHSSSSDSQSKKNQEDSDLFDDVRCGGRFSGYFVVEIIQEVCLANPYFLCNFVSTLLSLCQRIIKTHVQEVATASRRVTSMNSQMISRGVQQCLAAPILGIIEEATDQSSGAMSAVKKKVLSDDRGMKELEEAGTNIRSVIIVVRLLSDSELPFSFDSDFRKRYLQLLSTILDKSDCVPLLLTVVGIVGKWLVDPTTPITKEERIRLLNKMNFHQLTDVPGEPLASLVTHIALEIASRRNSKMKSRKRRIEEIESIHQTKDNECAVVTDDDSSGVEIEDEVVLVVKKLMTSYSLTADYDRRLSMAKIFTNANLGLNSKVGVTNNFIRLLDIDLKGLGEKLWVHTFVEQMIECSTIATKLSFTDELNKQSPPITLPGSLNQEKSDGVQMNKITAYKKMQEKLKFLRLQQEDKKSTLLRSVSKLAAGNTHLCEHMFREFFKAAWSADPSENTRRKIQDLVEALLAQPYHAQFVYSSRYPFQPRYNNGALISSHGFNMIQGVILAISDLKPALKLDTDLLVHIAKNFNAWHQVIHILESDYSSCTDRKEKVKYSTALRCCYDALGELDINISISRRLCHSQVIKQALSCELYNLVTDALVSYNNIMNNPSDDLLLEDVDVIEERFVSLYRESQQWAVLLDYSKSTENPSLMMECAWKARDWKAVQSLLPTAPIVAGLEIGEPENKIDEIYLAIGNGKLGDVEKLHLQAVQLCLHKWQLLPSVAPGCNAHISLLQQFHRLVELRESGQIMVETRNHSTKGTLPDLKNLLSAWRNRLPNDHDPVSVWSDLLTWRSHIFSAITHNFQWSEPNDLALLHDKPWTAIRMARAARKHNMKDVALMSLGKLTDTAMNVPDAFAKLREQIVLCRDSNSPQEYQNGLNIVQTTNLSFFDEKQKSELFRLKAIFFSLLRHKPQANQAFCHSVQICPNYGKSWTSWGLYCSSLSNHIENKILTVGGDAKEKATLLKKSTQYLVQAMGSYLEALLSGNEDARQYLPHTLWMVRRDGNKAGILSETLERRGKLLPEWLWLPWMPQLLTSLGRVESQAVKRILAGICVRYPQALYYYLRTYYLERLDIDRLRSNSKAGIASTYAQELVNTLRKSHPGLWVSLESITDEFINRFRPSFEEELLTAITALLQRALPQQEQRKKHMPEEKDNQALFSSFSRTLKRVSAKFFRPISSIEGDQRSRKEIEFSVKYKEMFEKDFLEQSPPTNDEGKQDLSKITSFDLDVIIDRLKKWKEILLPQVDALPTCAPLQHFSPALASIAFDCSDLLDSRNNSSYKFVLPSEASRELANTITAAIKSTNAAVKAAAAAEANVSNSNVFTGIEVPGRYLNYHDSRPKPELHPTLVRFVSKVGIIQRDGQAVRRIGLVASDGKCYYFGFQYVTPYNTWSGERNAQVHYLLDNAISRNLVSSRKNVFLRPNPVIPLAQKLRMTEESLDEISLTEVFELHLKTQNTRQGCVKEFYTKRLSDLISREVDVGEINSETKSNETKDKNYKKNDAQLTVYNEICEKMVSDDILLKYLKSRFDNPEAFFSFRKLFAMQLAANCILQYTFCATDRTPNRFVFNARTGEVLSPDFQLCYSSRGLLEQKELPFRLTRNIKTALGPILFDGTFVPAMASIAAAFSSKSSEMHLSLCLLLRDDIISWYASKSFARAESETRDLERQLDPRIIRNAELVMSRFKECAPSKASNADQAVDSKLRDLIDSATKIENLSRANVAFEAWL